MRLSLVASTLAVLLCGTVPASAALVTYTQAMGGFTHDSDTVNAAFNTALGGGYTHLSFLGASSPNGASYSADVTFSTSTGIFGGPNSPNVNFNGQEIGPSGTWDGILNIDFNGNWVSTVGFGLVEFNGPVEVIRVYDENGALLTTFNNSIGGLFSLWGVQATAGEHIGRIELDGNFFAIQDIEYSQVNVPEPVSMVLVGLGLMGVAARRRRKV